MNETKTKARTCVACGSGHRAVWPKDNPYFCSMRCAAVDNHMNSPYRWCGKHHEWYHEDDGCYECEKGE